MAHSIQVILAVVVVVILSFGAVSAVDDYNFIFTTQDDDRFTWTNFVQDKLRLPDAAYERLMVHLGDQLSSEDVAIPVDDYFQQDVESDEEDELQYLNEYNLDEDEDEVDVNEFIDNLPNDASISSDFGKREFKFTKVLQIRKNGTKTFSKFRQSVKTGGRANVSDSGNYNTSLDVTTSASGKFDVNITDFSKGQQKTTAASGTVVLSSSSKSKIEKRRLIEHATAESSITVQKPTQVRINDSVRSASETLKLPFRSYLTLYKAEVNTTADTSKFKAKVAVQVISHVAFANKTVSLTKSCIKASVKRKSVSADEESVPSDSQNLFQFSLIKAKTHTWTKVVSQSKAEVVVDVITCTKTRIYGKSVVKGAFVIFYGSGQVSWEKSRMTINTKGAQNLSLHGYGVHFVKTQLKDNSFITQVLGSSFEILK